ncbi:MAG TPA: hypothetical protein VLG11_04845 [Candidatus Saccharimonadales bacterium]|nr:hypothetical protein [Candidatus Saccharimonadales bacterium]
MPLHPDKLRALSPHLPLPASLLFDGGNDWQEGMITQMECFGTTVITRPERAPGRPLSNIETNLLALRALGVASQTVADTFGMHPRQLGRQESAVCRLFQVHDSHGVFGPAVHHSIEIGILDVRAREPEGFGLETVIAVEALMDGVAIGAAAMRHKLPPKTVRGAAEELQQQHGIEDELGLILLAHAKGMLGYDPFAGAEHL